MRRFGVEIEHQQPKFRCADGNTCTPRRAGHYACQVSGFSPEFTKEFPGWGNIHADGSGVEISSPILCGEEGMEQLKKVMEFCKSLGGKTLNADGMHVHHDAPEYLQGGEATKIQRVKTLLHSWCNNQAIINELVMNHRRADWFKCELAGFPPTSCYRQITSTVVDEILKTLTEGSADYYGHKRSFRDKCYTLNRMYALNVSAIGKTGSIEIRQYQGTLNFDRARAWIRFGQQFIETCLQDDKTPIAPYTSIDGLMRDIGLDSFERGILTEVGR